jgi:hypothetical protein
MGESAKGNVCPYCSGKGYVSVPAETPLDDDSGQKRSPKTTWVRKACPLCDGKGRVAGDDPIVQALV